MDLLIHHHHRHHSSSTIHRSISDLDEFRSPLRANSPLRSDDISSSTSTAIIAVTSVKSPLSKTLNPSHTVMTSLPSPSRRLNVAPLAKSLVPARTQFRPAKEEAVPGSGGGGREVVVERVQLGFRVCEMVLCLTVFSLQLVADVAGWWPG
ncbi:uncharacterized protein LOC143532664 [Bidens hawaiensis]|uniref:uncharacterized protein LOC143532664 n=1 Tax=Bidens hawaiensis TaxID=980011 RepID=UPI00404AD406